MDTLHTVLRSIRGETKAPPRNNHVTVFREFLDHLERASRKPKRSVKGRARSVSRRGK
ncbi:MAG: hypothetical protein AB1490_10995 [Pseudomonadota bacterium]